MLKIDTPFYTDMLKKKKYWFTGPFNFNQSATLMSLLKNNKNALLI